MAREEWKVGWYVDYLEQMRTWSVVKILEINPNTEELSLEFDGWSAKWNTTCKLNSRKLAPFRSKSIGYTGQKETAIRTWVYSASEVQENEEYLNTLIKGSLSTGNAGQTTQYLRGKLFILVDNLLVNTYKKNEHLTAAKFFCTVITYVIEWVKRSNELFPACYEGLNNPDLFLTDDKVALALSWPELLITLRRIFGLDNRTSKFHKSYNVAFKEYEPWYGSSIRSNYNQPTLFFINYFGKMGGFEALIHILSQKDERQKAPFELLKDFPIYEIGTVLEKKFAETLLPNFKELVLQRIESISSKDLKDLNKETVNEIIFKTKRLMTESFKKPDLEQLEKADLSLILKYFKSPFMEKRLKGLNEIKDLTEKSAKSPFYKEPTWPPSKFLADWILTEQIVEQIFAYSHAEMVKRVSDILIFLHKNDALTNEHLELLWDSAADKHDSLVIETHKAIMDLSVHITLEMQLILYEKMKKVDLHNYDERFLKMVKEFTLRILDQSYSSRTQLEVDVGVEIFAPLMEDSCIVNFCDIAVGHLAEIMRHSANKNKVYKRLEICVDNVIKNNSVPQSLKLFKLLLPANYASNVTAEYIKRIDASSEGIINKILIDFEMYMKIKSESLENVTLGRYTHKENIKIRLKTIEYIMFHELLPIELDHFKLLWKIFVGKSISQTDSEIFFKWLNKTNKERIHKTILIQIFNDLFCESLPKSGLSLQAFECFKTLFFIINQQEKYIEMKLGVFISRNSESLIGLDHLYQIVLGNNSAEVSQSAGTLLVSLYLKLGKSISQAKTKIWEEMISEILRFIETDRENSELISKALNLLQIFLEETYPVQSIGQNKLVSLFFKSPLDKDYQRLQFNGTDSMRTIRKRLAEHYKQPLQNVTAKIDGIVYDSSNDNVYASSFRNNVMIVEFCPPKPGETSPKEFLAKHQPLQDLLFNLLSDPDKTYCSEAWTLLTSLPINERIKHSLVELEENIEEIIDHNSLYKLLYCLVIVKELIQKEGWVEKFRVRGGIDYILQLFKEKNVFSLSAVTCLKYSTVMITLIEEFFKVKADAEEVLIEKLLDCLIVIGKYSVDPDDEEIAAVARIAKNIFTEIYRENHETVTKTILKYQKLSELIESTLLVCQNKYYPNSIVNLLLEITTNSPQISPYLVTKLFEQLNNAISNKGSLSYWSLLSHVIKENVNKNLISSELKHVKSLLKNYPPELSSKEKDIILWGLLSILRVSIECKYFKVGSKFIDLILHECLFETSSSQYKNPPKCKSDENRQLAFSILEISCNIKPKILSQIIKYLSKFHEDPHWRTGKYTDWNYSPVSLEKSITGYVGLKNIGNICYMNSTLQQLFNIPTFLSQILNAKDQSENLEESVLHQLQFIFSGLKDSAKQYVNPKKLCTAFKDWEGKSINVMEQMDADEFFNNLMDKLENLLKGNSKFKNCIKNHFGGIQTTECIGKNGCVHRSERIEDFLTLPVQVKNKKSIYESLESFVEGEILEGDNAYQCDYCENKVTALRRVCIKHLPNTLIIVLRRFEFDFDTMNRVKVNDYCEFPLEIDMEPYTQEGLERKEITKELLRSENPNKEVPPRKFPDDYYKFNLKGIVIHMGTAENGHYYSYIQDRTSNKWHEFNDTIICPFSPEDIPSEAFGGIEKWQSVYSSSYTVNSREKYRNAYLLFYERDTKYLPRGKDEENLEKLSLTVEDSVGVEFQEVIDENERYWRCKSTFSPEYFVFVVKLLRKEDAEITKFACAFFFVIFIRSKDLGKIPEFMNYLNVNLKKFESVRQWMCEVICVKQILKELILECPISEKRKLIVGVFSLAFERLSPQFILRIFKMMLNRFKMAVNSKFPTSYFELLYILATKDPESCSQCLTVDLILKHFRGEEAKTDFKEEFMNTDIYLGYTNDFPDTDRTDRFSHDDSGKTNYYLGALLGTLADYFDNEQIKQVFDKNVLNTLIYINHKIGTRLVGQMYSKFCQKSKERNKEYIIALMTAFRDNDYDKSKIFFRQITCLLKLEDENQQERIEFIMKNLLDIMRENKIYFKITEVSIDFILKIAGKITAVRDWFYVKNKEIKWIETWLKDNLYQQNRSGAGQYKKTTQNLIQNTYVCKSNSERYEAFKKILKMQVADTSSEWDSDDDLPEEALKASNKIDIYDQNMQRWNKGVIQYNLGGLISVRIENSIDRSNKWYEIQSDFIAPDGAKVLKYSNR